MIGTVEQQGKRATLLWRDLSACGRQLEKSWNGDGDVVTYTHGVHDHLIRMARNDLSAKMRNHEQLY
jgi:hypothetical protein